MTRSRGGPPTQRQLRVGEIVRHALAQVFAREDLRDPDLAEVQVTVTEVRMSPDLKHATAFVTPFAGGDATAVVRACKRAAPFLRGRIAGSLDLKFTPQLAFEADHSFQTAERISKLLDAVVPKADGPENENGAP
jgi:ribosome-binding factor A